MQRTGLRAAKINFIFGALALSASCSSLRPDVIQVGPWFAPRSPSEVEIFSSREQTKKPWGAVAVIHSAKFSPNDKRSIEGSKKQARKMAADIGADGLIITEETVMAGSQMGVDQEQEVFISALAFKYVNATSTSTVQK